jgi:hypothetical protein
MIQKRATATLDILDIPLMALTPKLAMAPAHDFRLEADGCGGGCVRRNFRRCVTFAVAPDFDYGVFVGKSAGDGGEG